VPGTLLNTSYTSSHLIFTTTSDVGPSILSISEKIKLKRNEKMKSRHREVKQCPEGPR
jgi:hypothetical protein